jgi:hypothetical protein
MKTKKINFTVDSKTYEEWQDISQELVSKRYFRNKTDVFESFMIFLKKSTKNDLRNFKNKLLSL